MADNMTVNGAQGAPQEVYNSKNNNRTVRTPKQSGTSTAGSTQLSQFASARTSSKVFGSQLRGEKERTLEIEKEKIKKTAEALKEKLLGHVDTIKKKDSQDFINAFLKNVKAHQLANNGNLGEFHDLVKALSEHEAVKKAPDPAKGLGGLRTFALAHLTGHENHEVFVQNGIIGLDKSHEPARKLATLLSQTVEERNEEIFRLEEKLEKKETLTPDEAVSLYYLKDSIKIDSGLASAYPNVTAFPHPQSVVKGPVADAILAFHDSYADTSSSKVQALKLLEDAAQAIKTRLAETTSPPNPQEVAELQGELAFLQSHAAELKTKAQAESEVFKSVTSLINDTIDTRLSSLNINLSDTDKAALKQEIINSLPPVSGNVDADVLKRAVDTAVAAKTADLETRLAAQEAAGPAAKKTIDAATFKTPAISEALTALTTAKGDLPTEEAATTALIAKAQTIHDALEELNNAENADATDIKALKTELQGAYDALHEDIRNKVVKPKGPEVPGGGGDKKTSPFLWGTAIAGAAAAFFGLFQNMGNSSKQKAMLTALGQQFQGIGTQVSQAMQQLQSQLEDLKKDSADTSQAFSILNEGLTTAYASAPSRAVFGSGKAIFNSDEDGTSTPPAASSANDGPKTKAAKETLAKMKAKKDQQNQMGGGNMAPGNGGGNMPPQGMMSGGASNSVNGQPGVTTYPDGTRSYAISFPGYQQQPAAPAAAPYMINVKQ